MKKIVLVAAAFAVSFSYGMEVNEQLSPLKRSHGMEVNERLSPLKRSPRSSQGMELNEQQLPLKRSPRSEGELKKSTSEPAVTSSTQVKKTVSEPLQLVRARAMSSESIQFAYEENIICNPKIVTPEQKNFFEQSPPNIRRMQENILTKKMAAEEKKKPEKKQLRKKQLTGSK